jgi:hypothetical protein
MGRLFSIETLAIAGAALFISGVYAEWHLDPPVREKAIRSQPAMAHMNMVNLQGEKDFICLSELCDSDKQFQGLIGRRVYRNAHDAIFGIPEPIARCKTM